MPKEKMNSAVMDPEMQAFALDVLTSSLTAVAGFFNNLHWTDLQHAMAKLGKCGREVRRCRRLADPALAVNRKNLRALDPVSRIERDLDRAFPVGRVEAG